MNNAELIKALLICGDDSPTDCGKCIYYGDFCLSHMLSDAADALEAADKKIAAVREIIAEQPTVDAVPVVRCENCKWCAYPVPNSTKYGCKLFDRCVKHDWFCADGERKDGEHETDN